jgi:hypothetical protein
MLGRTFGCVRVVWNRTLAARHVRYQAEGKSLSYAESDRALTDMKKDPDLAFLNEVSSVPLQQALRHQHKAFSAFFARRARYPRFKSRQGRQSATYTRSAFRMKDGALWLAKTRAPLRFVWTWPDVGVTGLDPTSVTVARDPAGRWFVTFHVDVPDPAPLPVVGESAGVDVGLTHFAALSSGEKIPHPRDWERHQNRLRRYQRRLARCQHGSANRAKVSQFQDLLGVRAPAPLAEPRDTPLDVPWLRHPARPGCECREEHPCRRAGGRRRERRRCLRRRCKTGWGNPGAVAGETGTPTREGRNPCPLGSGRNVKFGVIGVSVRRSSPTVVV